MTVVKETRHLFDTDDILQLRLVCGYRDEEEKPCGGEVLYQFGKRKNPPVWKCPRCGEPWREEFAQAMPPAMREVPTQERASVALLDALETLVGPGCGKFTIRFEIDGDSDSQGR